MKVCRFFSPLLNFSRVLGAASFLSALVFAVTAKSADLGPHPGYLSSVEGERYELSREVIIAPLVRSEEPTLQERIFTERLTDDIQKRYEDQFGRTQGEQIESVPSRFFDKQVEPGVYVSEEEYIERQRRFGQYMAKRLIEYHVDNYLRESPNVRTVYELKERVSNVNVSVRQYKVRFKYSFSGNYLDIRLENPYNIDAKLTIESGADTITSIGYPVTRTVRVLADYRSKNDQTTISGQKQLNPRLGTSLTGVTNDLEDKVLVGLSWWD